MKRILRALKRGYRAMKHESLIWDLNDSFLTVSGEEYGYERESLKLLIDKVPKKRLMVEVGSLIGFSTRFFSQYFEEVISVDPYCPGYDPKDKNSGVIRLLIARDLFKIRFLDDPVVRQINQSSEVAAEDFNNRSIDFVYLDGGHDYDAVKRDIMAWLPKVKIGSVIAGDDYPWEGVKKAVCELLPDHDVHDKRWISVVK
ncbi:MAG: class I SAM-dependent methyltransferase [Opitutales bacterium]|nr:class I SAM-dependent methyltransferase [Opitutales bacterium]